MERLVINGGNKIEGEIRAQGAKNSVLPILAATLLVNGICIIHNIPKLRDVEVAFEILRNLGSKIKLEGSTVIIDNTVINSCDIPDNLMREMRSSIMFLGPVLARCKKANMNFPGGCELGPRPIDLHLNALSELGADICEEFGEISANVVSPRGRDIHLSIPSVGTTENILMFASICPGKTKIINAAREPEIVDLANFLSKMGIKIHGAGEGVIEISGAVCTNAVEYSIMPDRIVTSTYLSIAGITGGELFIRDARADIMKPEIKLLKQAGFKVFDDCEGIHINAKNTVINSLKSIKTMPYPGFPTDSQAIFMALMTKANGTTLFIENIFENRFRHAYELARMGADINTFGKVSIVTGCDKLYGKNVKATDLRAGASLIIAGLGAEGTTNISDIKHIDRGYENIERNLKFIGADIKRVCDDAKEYAEKK